MRDQLRRDVELSMRQLQHQLAWMVEHDRRGVQKYVDELDRTTEQIWATWGLQAVRSAEQALAVLDSDFRAPLLTDEERARIDAARPTVHHLRMKYTRAGGQLLPADVPPLQ